MSIEDLADILIAELHPSCRDSYCTCTDPRERFECMFLEAPEAAAKRLLEAMAKSVESTDAR